MTFNSNDVDFTASLENALQIAWLASRSQIPSEFDLLRFVTRFTPVINLTDVEFDASEATDAVISCVPATTTFVPDNETSNYIAEQLDST